MCVMVNGQILRGDITKGGKRDGGEKSDASLMMGRRSFRAPGRLLPGVLGTARKLNANISLCPSAHPLTRPHLPTYLIPPSFHPKLTLPSA